MSKKLILFIVVPLLGAFIINRIFFFAPSFLETAGSYMLYPVLRLSNTLVTPFKTMMQNQTHYEELLVQHLNLKKEYEQLLQENVSLKAIAHFAEQSRELREFKDRYNLESAFLSKIVFKALTPEEHFIIVNRGRRDGIKKNMIALYKFQIIGRVSQVFATYSKITLITDKHSKVAAYTNTNNAHGIVEGTNTVNSCQLRYISHLQPVQNGDFVLSSGQGLIFPEGFCLGKIVDIKTTDLCHTIEIQPLVNLKDIELCHLTNRVRLNLF